MSEKPEKSMTSQAAPASTPQIANSKKPASSARPTPVVRQTLTSKLRMERGNQYEFYKNKVGSILNSTDANTTTKPDIKPKTCNGPPRPTNLYKKPIVQNRPPSRINIDSKKSVADPETLPIQRPKSAIVNNATNVMHKSLKLNPSNKAPVSVGVKNTSTDVRKPIPVKKPIPSARLSLAPTRKPIIDKKPIKLNNTAASKPPVSKPKVAPRKSLTAIHFNRAKETKRDSLFLRTKSMTDMNEVKVLNMISPIQEVDESSELKTPQLMQRRSMALTTPASINTSYYSPYMSACTPAPQDMMRKLEDWLTRRGKSLGSYHHLKCFNLKSVQPTVYEENEDDENKENIEVLNTSDGSYKELQIDEESIVDTQKKDSDLNEVANDALFDLQKLILDGYPREQCEFWLDMIKRKCPKVDEHYQYWECKASLEEMRGNFCSAVEFYQKAIIKGAEVKNMENSLDNLLQKFSILKLSPGNATPSKPVTDKKRAKTILDARNVFKSCIINFAICSRTQKKDNPSTDPEINMKYTATPVRRSTRTSRSTYTSTPGVTLCSSLNNLDSPIRKSLHFQPNKAL